MSALRFSTAIALLAAAGIGPFTSAGQELQALRDDVRTADGRTDHETPVEKKPDSHNHEEEPCWDDSSCEDDEDPLNWLAAFVITAPYWAPAAMVGDQYQQPGYFAHFPHQYDCGYMLLDPVEALGVPGSREPYAWMARSRAEAGLDFERLKWVGGHVQIDTLWRLGVEAEFRQVQEDLALGRPDEVWLGASNVLFRFAQSETVQMRSGLGFNFLTDEAGSDFGFNFTYGGDWLPVRPWIFSAEVDLGTLGHSHAFHLRATAGMNWGISEVFIGYDYSDIGPTEIRGLVAGVRLWH